MPLRLALLGALLGFTLSHVGFTSWDEVHAMFTFADLRMFLTFALGVVGLGGAFYAIARRESPGWTPRPIHRGTVAGSVLFGVGWALSGGCPGVVLAQIGEGRLHGLFALAGILAGNALYGVLLEARLGTRAARA